MQNVIQFKHLKFTKDFLQKEINDVRDNVVMKGVLANQSILVNELYNDPNNYDKFELEESKDSFGWDEWNYNLTDLQKEEITTDISLDEDLFINKEPWNISEETFNEYHQEIFDSVKSYGYHEPEIFQYFLCDEYLTKKLAEKGEIIVNYDDIEQWWGRQACGQSITMDSCIREIIFDVICFRLDMKQDELSKIFKDLNISSDWVFNSIS